MFFSNYGGRNYFSKSEIVSLTDIRNLGLCETQKLLKLWAKCLNCHQEIFFFIHININTYYTQLHRIPVQYILIWKIFLVTAIFKKNFFCDLPHFFNIDINMKKKIFLTTFRIFCHIQNLQVRKNFYYKCAH